MNCGMLSANADPGDFAYVLEIDGTDDVFCVRRQKITASIAGFTLASVKFIRD